MHILDTPTLPIETQATLATAVDLVCSIAVTVNDATRSAKLDDRFLFCPSPLAWFLPGPVCMRGGAARQFASGSHFHRGIHPESTLRKSVG